MKTSLYAAAAALALSATPVLAEKSDRVAVDALRDRIAATRGEPGVQGAATATLDRAEAALKDLYRAYDDNEGSEARSITNEIETLMQVAKLKGATAIARANPPQQEAAAPPPPQVVVVERPAPAPQFRDGSTLVLSDVVFATGRAELKPGADARLRPMVEHLRSNPNVRVRIAGHTDSQGTDAANQVLSQRRAQAVRDRLASFGVEPSRIVATGYGEAQPVAPNDNPAGRQQNRRVEITLVGAAQTAGR